ncbi:MAG: hypothetical protein Q8P06_01355 [Candidatus Azambacteria bacterium]|nr:hypothetical protein [Candidatus Azambacteria bacterium]
MIYKINPIKDHFIQKIVDKSMKDLGKFYNINWTKNMPRIIILEDRKVINALRDCETEPWLVAWADKSKNIFILNKENFENQSSHKYSIEYYSSLIKHEISHLFFNIVSNNKSYPIWLCEGVAIYTSGQIKLKKTPEKFKTFLNFYNKSGAEVYGEAGFVIKLLVKKFGKNKLLKLIKSIKDTPSKKQFQKTFFKIYGFKIEYGSVNSLHKQSRK